MDDRQRQIRERAGLEESRVNVEFVEFLKKWGSTILMVAALGAGSMAGYRWYHQRVAENVAQAFAELELARSGGSPEALAAVAEQFHDVQSVAPLAYLEAADVYLRSVVAGVKPGTTVQPGGVIENPDDVMDEQARATALDRAASFYQRAYEASVTDRTRLMLSIGALHGLAAVAESREQWDVAKAKYEEIAKLTEGTVFTDQARLVQWRLAHLDDLKHLPMLIAEAEMPPLPQPEPVVTPESLGLPPGVKLERMEGPPPGMPGATPSPTPGMTPTAEPQPVPESPAPAEPAPAEPAPAEPAPAEPK
ncbi:MAG: hypothetical protein HUU18_03205 [Phycisphaerales bacterium]|nr:hypothetical protein [Phycisphaerales bacterium]